MKKWILLVLVLALVCVAPALAKNEVKKQDKPKAAPEQTFSKVDTVTTTAAEKQEKEALIANINNMRNQELRVAVLQQLLNEEIGRLRNVQAVFCDQYKLDIERFRNGLYRYDETLGKFVEQKSQ